MDQVSFFRLTSLAPILLDPFPNKPWFLRVCLIQALEMNVSSLQERANAFSSPSFLFLNATEIFDIADSVKS